MSTNKTTWVWTNQRGANDTFDEARPRSGSFDQEDPTRKLDEQSGTVSSFAEDEHTVHVGHPTGEEDDQREPVVGWLVVVKGPGAGASIIIAAGMSSIGRGGDQRISLHFGDKSISRSNHARMVYDSASRKFHLLVGDGQNLTRVNQQLLLSERELEGGELIQLGETQLRFVPFCNEQFDWSDLGDGEDSAG